MTTPFRCKQFTVHHDQCAMKIGTDAILLGAWAAAVEPKRILDIGTGSGIIALMLAQRFPAANVTAVEINSAACEQACYNFVAAPFSDRLTLARSAVQVFRPRDQYDLVVCNPPWFQRSFKSPDAARTMARHSDSLSLEELGTHASRLLSPGGVLDVILPVAHALTFTAIATSNDLHCHRVCEVRPTPTSRPKRRLLEFSNHLPEQDVCEQEMVKLDGKKYDFIVQKQYRWDAWAAPKGKDGRIDHNKAQTGDDLRDFVNGKLIPYERKLSALAALKQSLLHQAFSGEL